MVINATCYVCQKKQTEKEDYEEVYLIGGAFPSIEHICPKCILEEETIKKYQGRDYYNDYREALQSLN